MKTIVINVNPVAFTVASFEIGWGFIIAVLAAVLALLFFVDVAKSRKFKDNTIITLCVLIPLCGFIGAYLFGVIENLLFFHKIYPLISSSMRAYGLFLGAVVAGQIYVRITRISLWQLADSGIPCLILFMAVYRVGCVLVGCCYGIPSDLPWAVVYTNPGTIAPLGMAIHPTQIYHLLWNATVFVAVWVSRKRFNTAGLLGLLALILYSVGDFAIRFFRGDEPSLTYVTLSQITGIGIVVVSVYLFVLRVKTAGRRQEVDTVT